MYPDSESPEKSRAEDYLLATAINAYGDLLITSNLNGRQLILRKLFYDPSLESTREQSASNTTDTVAQPEAGKSRNVEIVSIGSSKTDTYLCTNEPGTEAVRRVLSPAGKVQLLRVVSFANNKKIVTKHDLLKDQPINYFVVQCKTRSDGQLQVVVDAIAPESRQFEEIPKRTVRTGDSNYAVTTVNSASSNHIRLFYDGESELLTPGNLRVDKSNFRLYPTPIAQDVFLDIETTGSKESVLSTLDRTVAITVPGNPMAVIEYPYKARNKRLFCVFGNSDKDIYKSCYLGFIKNTE